MKKLLGIVLTMLLCLSLLAVPVLGLEATATLSGPGTVRAGDTITLTFTVTGSNIYGISGTLVYDTQQVTLIGTKPEIGGDWETDFNGNNFMSIDEKLSTPINGASNIFTVSFLVGQLKAGEELKISVANVVASDGDTEVNIAEVGYSTTIAEPLSSNAKLQSLIVSNATISPAFDPDTTYYSTQVAFSISKLAVSAVPADGNAKVTVSSPTLTADGITNVTITVTAENGDKKVYTIVVRRDKDPNYVASSNCFLDSIDVTEFRLSPVFSKNITSYLIWLPYEVDQVSLKATASDSKASIKIEGGKDLVAGADNEILITVTAENGDQKVYTIIAKRAAPHNTDPTVSTTPTEPTVTEPTETTVPETTAPTQAPTESTAPTVPSGSGDDKTSSFSNLLVILYVIIGLAAAGGITVCVLYIIHSRKESEYDDEDEDEEDYEDMED